MPALPLALAWLGLIAAADDDAAVPAAALPPAATRPVDFARDIRPILTRSCVSCHGPTKRKAGLRLDRKADALAGGDSGPPFQPGRSAESLLVEYVAGLDPDLVMPPEGDRLDPEEVGLIRAWIDQGADWPDALAGGAEGTPAGSDHWAFRPPVRPEPPAVAGADWVRNPIDAFILARLEREGVRPSPEADRPTLIRRLALDLTGLPPTPEEVDAFASDPAPDAYERVVDRLLASPHYGERWGRHWLDLARYADSDGYEKDNPRPNAWRYRDWVIEAVNRDLPFDRFTIEQLAGDLLPDATLPQKTATGFHRNTLTNTEGGVDKEEFRVAAVVDRVNTTGTVWLGLTVGCAQCHTHKYDPLLHREYYGLFAFFNGSDEVDLPAPTDAEAAAYAEAKSTFDQAHAPLVAEAERYEREERPAQQAAWEATVRSRPAWLTAHPWPLRGDPTPDEIRAVVAIAPEDRTDAQRALVAKRHRAVDPGSVERDGKVTAHAKQAPKPPASKIPILAEAATPRATHIHIRGDFLRKGEPVAPHTPAVLPPLEPAGTAPTRLDLARWLVEPDHPLTARVAVNRVWRNLFGRGIVPTPDDLGSRGEPPSHPELLDWLATGYPALGWSQKALIRRIVTSATYRQASTWRADLAARDPLNTWVARQGRFRVEAELIRDLALAASGLLHPAIGGPSVRPPQPAGISELTYANSAKWVESQGPDRYRRALYTWFQRTSPYPMLVAFDAPDGNVCAVKRERSNTPLQALTLLNDAVFLECAQALGRRIVADESCDHCPEEQAKRGFRLAVGREPGPDEIRVLVRLRDRIEAEAAESPEAARQLAGPGWPERVGPAEAAAWVGVARAILNLDEFVTRE